MRLFGFTTLPLSVTCDASLNFVNTDIMLAGIIVIALIGLALEKLVFQRIEQFTLVRWGMLT